MVEDEEVNFPNLTSDQEMVVIMAHMLEGGQVFVPIDLLERISAALSRTPFSNFVPDIEKRINLYYKLKKFEDEAETVVES